MSPPVPNSLRKRLILEWNGTKRGGNKSWVSRLSSCPSLLLHPSRYYSFTSSLTSPHTPLHSSHSLSVLYPALSTLLTTSISTFSFLCYIFLQLPDHPRLTFFVPLLSLTSFHVALATHTSLSISSFLFSSLPLPFRLSPPPHIHCTLLFFTCLLPRPLNASVHVHLDSSIPKLYTLPPHSPTLVFTLAFLRLSVPHYTSLYVIPILPCPH